MTAMAHQPPQTIQTHAQVTRDVVRTLETPSRGYYLALFTAEAMTVFAVMTAGLFPIIHIGRQWIFYWLLPYPNQRFLWPNFKSPLIWDVFAIGTYLTVSTVFLCVGLVPDVAAVRDKVSGWR